MPPAPGPAIDGSTPDPAPAGPPSPVTQVLIEASGGSPAAQDRLLALVYEELRRIAGSAMAGERRAHTLQPTALVHEAYLRLFGREGARFESRAHFFKAAADAMRRILIDHARARGAQKRGGGGGGRAALQIEDLGALIEAPNPDGILALDTAISRLEGVDPEAASVVRLRFFAGLSEAAAAAALGISERTARRDWAYARAWLREALEREAREHGEPPGAA